MCVCILSLVFTVATVLIVACFWCSAYWNKQRRRHLIGIAKVLTIPNGSCLQRYNCQPDVWLFRSHKGEKVRCTPDRDILRDIVTYTK